MTKFKFFFCGAFISMAYRAPSGKIYEQRIGSRVQVKRGKAYKTSGGLTAQDIVINSAGRYVSAAKHAWGKKHGRRQLEDNGYAMFEPGTPGRVEKRTKRKKKSVAKK